MYTYPKNTVMADLLEDLVAEKTKLLEENAAASRQLDYLWNRLYEYEKVMKSENIDPNKGLLSGLPALPTPELRKKDSMPGLGEPFFNLRLRRAISPPRHRSPDGHRFSPGSVQGQIPHTIELYR